MVENVATRVDSPKKRRSGVKSFLRDRGLTQADARAAKRVADWVEGKLEINPPPGEAELFSALQVCACRAGRCGFARATKIRDREVWEQRWMAIRQHQVLKNMGLVYAVIGRFASSDIEREEKRSAGLTALLHSVDSFNPWLGFKFSTYAYHSIRRAIVMALRKETRFRGRTAQAEEWDEPSFVTNYDQAMSYQEVRQAMFENSAELDERERFVVSKRFPLDGHSSLTLHEVGYSLGVSKERVRQIQIQALAKLKTFFEGDPEMQ